MKLLPTIAAMMTAGALTGGAVTMVWGRAPAKEGLTVSIDQLQMTELCQDGIPIYNDPDGALWRWSPGWKSVDPRQAAVCAD